MQQDRCDVIKVAKSVSGEESMGEKGCISLSFKLLLCLCIIFVKIKENVYLRNCFYCVSASKHEIQNHPYLYHISVKCLPYQGAIFSLKA